MTLRYGFAHEIRKIKSSLFLLLFILVALVYIVQGANASLEISISLVEGDVFGPGDSFHIIAEIRNREAQGRIDVITTYGILDLDGYVVLSNSKTVAVETKSSFSEEFTLPTSIVEGTYILMANVSMLDGSKWSTASRSFSVVVVTESEQRLIEYVMAGALIFTGGALFYEHRRITKLKVSGNDLKKFIGEKDRK